MADKKISALTAASTPLAGTEVLPIVQSGSTVKVSVENVLKSTQPSGSANGVLYLNGSKIQSSGATFQFDGTNVGLAGAPSAWAAFSAYQVGNGAMASLSTGNNSEWSSNTYFSAAGWRYTTSNTATHYQQFNGQHLFFTSTDVTPTAGNLANFANVLKTDIAGDVTAPVGNFVQGTAAKGVNFTANTPAAGMTSQLLNWYEEGTWTPNQGAGLTLVGAFSSAGTYTRIGRQVFIRGSVSGATSVAVASAGAITTNLPYSAAADATGTAINAADNASSILRVSSATLTAATAIVATTTITFSAVYSV